MTDPNTSSNVKPGAAKPPFLSPYGWYSVVLLIASVFTLIPSYFIPLISDPGKLSKQVIVHGAVFIGWYALVVMQSGMASRKRITIHKRLGYLSIGFAVFLIVSGAMMLIGVMNSYQPEWTEDYLASRTSFVWATCKPCLASITCFTSR